MDLRYWSKFGGGIIWLKQAKKTRLSNNWTHILLGGKLYWDGCKLSDVKRENLNSNYFVKLLLPKDLQIFVQ